MEIIFKIFTFLFTIITFSQDAVHNYGTIQIHNTGAVGFHMDVINDGTFNQNLGLVGFYSYNKSLTVSGTETPIFFDSEVFVEDDLYLENSIGIRNNMNLISGKIITPRNDKNIHLNFINEAFYTGENNSAKVDGYSAMTNKDSFTFPIGDDSRLRTLSIASEAVNATSLCAYFFEDPNIASSFSQFFNTNITRANIFQTSTKEFWHLEGDLPSKATLTWDNYSEINLFTSSLSELKVVGWNTALQYWEDLGNTAVSGDFNNGTLTSNTFIPSEYSILTFAGNEKELNTFNYYISPNGDGINDVLEIEGILESKDNNLSIYNRHGVLVFSKDNYTNDFNGFSNRNLVYHKNKGLPSGIYFYVVTLKDVNQIHQGHLYLTSNEKN